MENLRVLIIEDLKPMRDLLKEVMYGMGVGGVMSAENGEVGLNILSKMLPDIVFCDWDMPKMSGIEFIKHVRRNDLMPRQVPIVLLTGYASPNKIKMARDAGVTEYLIKPFRSVDIAKRIEYIVNKPRDFILSNDFVSKGYIDPEEQWESAVAVCGVYPKAKVRKEEIFDLVRGHVDCLLEIE